MKQRWLVTLVAPLAASLFFGCAAKNYDALLPQMQENFKKINTYQAKPSLYIPEAGTDVQVQASFKAPDKAKLEVTYPISITIVCDGKKISGCVPDYNTCVSLPLDGKIATIPVKVIMKAMAPHLSWIELVDKYNYKMVGKEKAGDVKLVVFELERKTAPTDAHQAPKAKIWVEESRPVAVKIEVYDASGVCKGRNTAANHVQVEGIWIPQEMRLEDGDGSPLATISVSDITVNKDIPDANFEFKAPKNAIVLDSVPDVSSDDIPDLLFLD